MTMIATATLAAGLWAQSSANPNYTTSTTWAQLPPGTKWGETSSVTSDGKDQILVLRRMDPVFLVFKTDGKFVKTWGDGLFKWAHGIRVDKDGFIWATDGQDNLIYKFTMDGKILLKLGKKGVAGENTSQDTFNRPTDIAVAPNGDFFVTDGYGNSRVVKFSKDGKFIKIIGGKKGTGQGEFNLPHSVVIDSKGRLIVGDRENARIQIFDQDGKFLEMWAGLGKPYGLYIAKDDTLYVGDADGGTITIAKNGKPVDVIKDLGRPHWIGMDPSGALYMADVRAQVIKKIVKK
jgi:DNA-binding beta-propeller fold protein YncE